MNKGLDVGEEFKRQCLARLPKTEKALIILSGGMDSTIAMRLAVEKYGKENVFAISFNYGQLQEYELEKAKQSTKLLGVRHRVYTFDFLKEISAGFSANMDGFLPMPTIQDVLGNPRPKTYVPNRNMVLMSLAAAYAETREIETIIIGLQVHDQYGYHDTSESFLKKINDILSENRIIKIKIVAPFYDMSKTDELKLLKKLDQNLWLTNYTWTCYNPKYVGMKLNSCGECPSCSERRKAFENMNEKDPLEYFF